MKPSNWPQNSRVIIWRFPKLEVPQNGWFISWTILPKWMIWKYPHFRTPPYLYVHINPISWSPKRPHIQPAVKPTPCLPSPIFHARWSWILWWLAGIVLGTGSTTSDCLINFEFTYLSYVVIYCSSRPICIMARVVLWGLHAQQRSMMKMWDVSTCQTAVNDHLGWRK